MWLFDPSAICSARVPNLYRIFVLINLYDGTSRWMTAVPAPPSPPPSAPLPAAVRRVIVTGSFRVSSRRRPPSLPPHPGSVERRRRRRCRLARSSNPRRPIPGAAAFSNTERRHTHKVQHGHVTERGTYYLQSPSKVALQLAHKFGVNKVKYLMQQQRCSTAHPCQCCQPNVWANAAVLFTK